MLSVIYSAILLFAACKRLADEDPVLRKRISKGITNSEEAKSMDIGDISIISFNVYNDDDTKEAAQKEILRKMVSKYVPTILALQGASEDIMKFIDERMSNSIKKQYGIVGDKVHSVDISMRKNEFRPIIYNKKELELTYPKFADKNLDKFPSGALPLEEEKREEWQAFASYAIFTHKKTKTKILFINVDMFSVDAKFIKKQLLYLVQFAADIAEKENFLVMVGGSIEASTSSIRGDINSIYVNSLDLDDNNRRLSKNTLVHPPAESKDLQRDYLLILKDHLTKTKDRYLVNYSRILTDWDNKKLETGPELDKKNARSTAPTRKDDYIKFQFEHYPIYTILSF